MPLLPTCKRPVAPQRLLLRCYRSGVPVVGGRDWDALDGGGWGMFSRFPISRLGRVRSQGVGTQ